MSDPGFRPAAGDIVALRSSPGIPMTVARVDFRMSGTICICVWIGKDGECRSTGIPTAALRPFPGFEGDPA